MSSFPLFRNHPGACCLLFFLLFASCRTLEQSSAPPGGIVQWRSLTEGKTEAVRKNLPMLVDFYTTQICPRCSCFTDIYSDPQLAGRIEEQFIPVRISVDRPFTPEEEELNLLLGSDHECKLVFLHPDGSVIRDEKGQPFSTEEMLNKDEYLRQMEEALLLRKR